MNFTPPTPDENIDHLDPSPVPTPGVVAQQRAHLRRIMFGFVAVVLLLPFAGLGGYWSWLLLPVVVVAALALREAIRLRRSVNRYGAPDRR